MRQTISKKYQDQIFDATIAYDDNPEALAAYIENGGDLDAGARKNLASLIRRYFPKPRGGKNIRSDVDFYMFVREWCLQEQRGVPFYPYAYCQKNPHRDSGHKHPNDQLTASINGEIVKLSK